jgi:hypothetical protein
VQTGKIESDEVAQEESEVTCIKRLASACLVRAILDARGEVYDKREGGEELDAWRWMHSQSVKPFSFLWICELLNLTPSCVLRSVSRLEDIAYLKYFVYRSRSGCRVYKGVFSRRFPLGRK